MSDFGTGFVAGMLSGTMAGGDAISGRTAEPERTDYGGECCLGSVVRVPMRVKRAETREPTAPTYRPPLPSEKPNPLWDGGGTIGESHD